MPFSVLAPVVFLLAFDDPFFASLYALDAARVGYIHVIIVFIMGLGGSMKS